MTNSYKSADSGQPDDLGSGDNIQNISPEESVCDPIFAYDEIIFLNRSAYLSSDYLQFTKSKKNHFYKENPMLKTRYLRFPILSCSIPDGDFQHFQV